MTFWNKAKKKDFKKNTKHLSFFGRICSYPNITLGLILRQEGRAGILFEKFCSEKMLWQP